jgi:hypothetical protein
MPSLLELHNDCRLNKACKIQDTTRDTYAMRLQPTLSALYFLSDAKISTILPRLHSSCKGSCHLWLKRSVIRRNFLDRRNEPKETRVTSTRLDF